MAAESRTLIPCPVVRTLLNEGWIHPDAGGLVSTADLGRALRRLGLDAASTAVLVTAARAAAPGPGGTFAVYALRGGPLDHNADTGILREEVLGEADADGWLTAEALARVHQRRLESEPGLHGRLQGGLELAALVHLFGRRRPDGEWALHRDDLLRLYRDNRFPRGWKPRGGRMWTLPVTVARFFAAQLLGRRSP